MLQQTTVKTVASRWQRFLDRFPDVRALAAATLDDVLNEWSGLGYYARARNLHAAARRIASDFNGEMPTSFDAMLALPGMGRYTAAAVASIAHGEAVAVVDANVERVIARLDAVGENIASAAAKRRLWDRAQDLLAPRRAGDWNQAMMELGATVCLPRAPQCPACPVREWCRARATGTPEAFPPRKAKPAMQSVREVAIVLRRGGKVLVLRRPPNGSFAAMWELPRGEVGTHESSRDAAHRIVRELLHLDAEPRSNILRLRHVVMRRSILLNVWTAELSPGRIRRASHDAHEWITPGDWLLRPISTTQKHIAQHLRDSIST